MEDTSKENFWSDFRVGALTFLAISILIAGITLAGGTKGLILQETSTILASMKDVGGLKKGSAVTMGGMTIGEVTNIAFSLENPRTIEVAMNIKSSLRSKIKSDSAPSIRTQGMLGDRYIEISMGSEDQPLLRDGEQLLGKTATDFDETLLYAKSVLSETEKMLTAINEQKGTLGHIFYDAKLYDALTETTEELRDLIRDFKENPKKYIDVSIF